MAPSPRVQFRVRGGPWRPFRPGPSSVSLGQMLVRLAWNPGWNEDLFLVSCAERLVASPSPHVEGLLYDRVATAVPERPLQIRLVFVHREGDRIVERVDYIGPERAAP